MTHVHEGCPEGTKRVPPNFEPCCEVFESHLTTCYYDLRYEFSSQHGWGIRLADEVGGGMISISFCPHCGMLLIDKLGTGKP